MDLRGHDRLVVGVKSTEYNKFITRHNSANSVPPSEGEQRIQPRFVD